MKCSAPRVLLWASFLLAVVALSFSGFAHNKSWFDVPNESRSPSFGLWHVCYDGKWRDCSSVMTVDAEYKIGTAVFITRALIIASMVFNLSMVVITAMTLMGSDRLIGYTFIFPIVAGSACVILLLGDIVWEAGVRLQVINQMQQINQTDLRTATHFAGWSAWLAFAAALLNCGVSTALYLKTRSETYI